MITARGFGWRYAGRPVAALHDVDLDIGEGEWVLVTGASGSGKSTLGLAIAGLVPHEFAGTWTGALRVAGHDVARTPRRLLAEAAGVLFQEPAAQLVMEHVDDDVAFGLENRAWPRDAMHERVGEMLGSLGIGHLRRRVTNGLSGGEQQRVALAGVLAPRPRVLVLDEPTSNLDALGTAAFYRALAGLRAMPDRPTVLLIEHRVDVAVPLVDTVLALDGSGGPLALGPADRVFATDGDALEAEGIWLPGEAGRRVAAAVEGAPAAATPPGTGVLLLELSSVTYRYERDAPPAVDDVSGAIADGERVALLGANGSGKSTLGRLAAGLLAPSGGVVRLGGTDPARLPASRLAERATFVFQDPAIQFVRDRVADELHAGLTTPDQHAAADALLSELDLDRPGLREASPYTLSGGEQRRLSVATALVRDPALVVLDEPTYGQDRLRYEALVMLLRRRLTDGGTLLAATHDVVFAAEMTSRALVLDGGRLVTDGPVGAALSSSKEPDVSSPRPPAGLAP